MPKTVAPGTIRVTGIGTFVADAVPDLFDERDLPYTPRLEPLAPALDTRDLPGKYVMKQRGNSCTGHAVAAVANTVLARSEAVLAAREGASANGAANEGPNELNATVHVSPYMLYYFARRYDEFEGERDSGSSLRGVLKGWFNHGLARDDMWPRLRTTRDVEEPAFVEHCIERPLGAFYRVQALRLDDMQSAVNELHSIAASAIIDDGWGSPVPYRRGNETIFVIRRAVNSMDLGGHAFAIVGYNEIGFLVQNSWGRSWGKEGFATLPYETWLETGYDAWVVRPGVPNTPFASGKNRAAGGTGGVLITAPAPDIKRLAAHVVNIGNDGKLSTHGKFESTPKQVDGVFQHMELWHNAWRREHGEEKRNILLYAHGGLVSEAAGLQTAQKQLNWWLNNRIYPVSFAWQSGLVESFINRLADEVRNVLSLLPFGRAGLDILERLDARVERIARSAPFRAIWDEMKENARAASRPIARPERVRWQALVSASAEMATMPAASLTVSRLARYIEAHGADNVAVHLVGHSAGSIFHAAMLDRLAAAKIRVESLTLLAPALRVDEFRRDVLPRIGPRKTVARFATFAMSDRLELDDVCGAGGINAYHKSLLYLVSRALERAEGGFEVPLVGMARYFDRPIDASGQTLRAAIAAVGGEAIFSPADEPRQSRSDASSHGVFDDDTFTMTSVAMRILGRTEGVEEYRKHAALRAMKFAPPLPVAEAPVEAQPAARPAMRPAAAAAPGAPALVETAEPQRRRPRAPAMADGFVLEAGEAPRSGYPVVEMMAQQGWRPADGATPASTRGRKAVRANGRVKAARIRTAPVAKRGSRSPS